MLEPSSRRLLFESLAPPPGFRLDWTIGTTYTLDLIALLAAPVAFAFSDWQDREGRPTPDPLALLKAVRQFAGRMCLFCHAGHIHVPKSYQALLSSLEGSVIEASAPRGGSFHPKVWFLRYVSNDAEVRYRFLCLSRNMTFDRAWDTMLCLDGELTDRSNAFQRNHPLGQFAESLPKMSVRGVSSEWKKRIDQLAYEIRRVDFEVPEPFSEIEFWPIGIDRNDVWPFSDSTKRMLIISPYVSDSLLKEIAASGGETELISRGDQLEFLHPATLEPFKAVWVLDDAAEPEPGGVDQSAVPDADTASDAGANDDQSPAEDFPLVGLHAKVYVADEGRYASLFTGSANATRATFHDNVEFLTQLRGKRSQCGVDAILGRADGGDEDNEPEKKKVACLADLLQPFKPRDTAELIDQATKDFERFVDEVAQQIAASLPVACCEAAADAETFSLALAPTKEFTLPRDRAFELFVRPASMPAAQPKAVAWAEKPWVTFGPMSILGLTSFFVFQVTTSEPKAMARQFVLNIPLTNEPADRKEALLRHLLSDRERVLRFMLLLLSDLDAGAFADIAGTGSGEGKPFHFGSSFDGGALFESLMRCLDRDPERLRDIAEMISDLGRTEDGKRLLPENLDSIWNPIWTVATQELERNRKGDRR